MRPESGLSRPVQQRIIVVLPAPLGPSTAVTSPAAAVRLKPSRTTRPPKPQPDIGEREGGGHLLSLGNQHGLPASP